jgi:hypothetical protein
MGLEQPPGGPQRTFLVLVLQNLVRLTAWDPPLLRQVGLAGAVYFVGALLLTCLGCRLGACLWALTVIHSAWAGRPCIASRSRD